MPPRKRSVSSPLQILLVEDSPGDVRLLREAFKQVDLSAKLHVVADGEQALSYLRRERNHSSSVQPTQLVLLDLNLPRKDGREVLSEMKQDRKLREIPVVMLSTSNRKEDAERARNLKASRFITKPSNFEGLMEFGRDLERLSQEVAYPKPPAKAAKPRVRSASQRSA